MYDDPPRHNHPRKVFRYWCCLYSHSSLRCDWFSLCLKLFDIFGQNIYFVVALIDFLKACC